MTNKEFSDGFDTLLNSQGALPNISLDEYEKSLFLTTAQEQLIMDLYSGRDILIPNVSFEETEEMRRYLSSLIQTYRTDKAISGKTGLSKESVFFQLPQDLWFITYESVILRDPTLGCSNGKEASVIPTLQDELYRLKDNPFRGPGKSRVLRLDIQGNVVELISRYRIEDYIVRYLSQPSPIVLVDLPDNLSINGVSKQNECKLNPAIHRPILERAVRLSIISKTQLAGAKD